jgi:hypothetical protein
MGLLYTGCFGQTTLPHPALSLPLTRAGEGEQEGAASGAERRARSDAPHLRWCRPKLYLLFTFSLPLFYRFGFQGGNGESKTVES